MKRKILISDVDGTIIHTYGHLTEKTKKVLKEFQERGNLIILASGRSYYRMLDVAKELEMDKYGGYLIDVNGIGSYDMKTGQRQRFYEFSREEMDKIFDYYKNDSIELKVYFDDGIYTWLSDDIYQMKKKIKKEMKLPEDYPWNSGVHFWLCDNRDGYPNQKLIQSLDEVDGVVNKIALAHEKETLLEFQKDFIESGKFDQYDIYFSSERQLDIVPKSVSKGIGVKRLLENLGLEDNDLYIFGDSENDLSMFELSENSYAVANADMEVLDKGYKTTDSNDQDGLANVIERLLNEEEK